MKICSETFDDGNRIPERCAFAKINPQTHVELSDNRNPHLAWSELPRGSRSLVLICSDPDVPSRPDDVNQEGRTVPADLPRVEFHHWVLVDLSPTITSIREGDFSIGVTPRGKKGPDGPHHTRQGLNNYTQWFAGDKDMSGEYFGYDGPCPPWNDSIVHHYRFTLYAIDLEKCPVSGTFYAPDLLKAIDGHVLGKASIVGTYSLNPNVAG